MKDPDQMATWPPSLDGHLHESLSAYDLAGRVDEEPTTVPGRLVSLGFLAAALRRKARLWCTLAGIGLLVGCGYFAAFPHPYKATVSILLADEPNSNPDAQILTDLVLAKSLPVAESSVQELKLSQTPGTFLASYVVTEVTSQVIQITVSASSSGQAVQTASVVAHQFLEFRAQYEQTQEQQTAAELDQQVNQARQRLSSIDTQISKESADTGNPDQQSILKSLHDKQAAASSTLSQVQNYAIQTQATTATATRQVIGGSQVLNVATAVKSSKLMTTALYVFGGLFGGLVLGIAIVIIGAITSDRLLRRDDIAYAIGAPVRLSVGSLRRSRWLPDLPGQSAARREGMDRLTAHLRRAAARLAAPAGMLGPGGGSDGRGLPAGLAVIAVEDTRSTAAAVVAVAVAAAQEHRRVVLADLSRDAEAARLLGVGHAVTGHPTIARVRSDGVEITVVVPGAEDAALVGPLPSRAEEQAQPDGEVAVVCADADLVLSLVTLDPASGGGHLSTWAADAVVVVTAGQATAVRIRAVGGMVRLSGTRLASVVVAGADKKDESLGMTDAL